MIYNFRRRHSIVFVAGKDEVPLYPVVKQSIDLVLLIGCHLCLEFVRLELPRFALLPQCDGLTPYLIDWECDVAPVDRADRRHVKAPVAGLICEESRAIVDC